MNEQAIRLSEKIDRLLYHPMKRDDIQGKDEDLSAIEEFYLQDIEATVNADFLNKIKRQEDDIISQIKEHQSKKRTGNNLSNRDDLKL